MSALAIRKALPSAFALLTLCLSSNKPLAAQTPPTPSYSLMWSDEFNGTALDRSAWCTRYAHGGGAPLQVSDSSCLGPTSYDGTGDFLQDELQRYRDYNAFGKALHVVKDGYLSLRCTKSGQEQNAFYESAMVRSKLSIQPSTYESYFITARVRMPDVRGSFPAFWLASGYGADGRIAWPPEIDVFEGALNGGEDRSNMLRVGTQIQGAQTATKKPELSWTGPRFDRNWHNFIADRNLRNVWVEVGLEWSIRGVCTYINGELAVCENYRWVDNNGAWVNPANLLFNLAVGGEWAGRYGVDESKPMQLDIDYVRVWRKRGILGAPVPIRGSTKK